MDRNGKKALKHDRQAILAPFDKTCSEGFREAAGECFNYGRSAEVGNARGPSTRNIRCVHEIDSDAHHDMITNHLEQYARKLSSAQQHIVRPFYRKLRILAQGAPGRVMDRERCHEA